MNQDKVTRRAWDMRMCPQLKSAAEIFRGQPLYQIVTFYIRDDEKYLISLTNKRPTPEGVPVCTLTVRDRSVTGEPERTLNIPIEIYSALKGLSRGEVVKVRRTVIGPENWGKLFISLSFDQYQERHGQFTVLEAEFSNADEADVFTLPPWAVGAIEITGNPMYDTHRLAITGTTPSSQ